MSATREDNVSYYETLADDYDLFFSDLERNMKEEGDWLAEILHGYNVKTVLDASCGSGRQAVPLRERGFDLSAADPSPAMLRAAAAVADERGVCFRTVTAGFAELSSHFHEQFDAVIALGNGLCNLEHPEAIEDALQSVCALCRKGGVCLIGIKDFAALKRDGERFHGHRILDRDGKRNILFEVWDFDDPILISTAYLVQQPSNGECASVQSAQTREYMLHDDELRRMASATGFRNVRRLDHPNEAVYALEP